MAVDNANTLDLRERGAIEHFVDVLDGLFGALADDVDLAVAGVEARALAESHALFRFVGWSKNFFDVRNRNLHFQEAGVDFEDVSGQQAADAGGLADAFQSNSRAGLDF